MKPLTVSCTESKIYSKIYLINFSKKYQENTGRLLYNEFHQESYEVHYVERNITKSN